MNLPPSPNERRQRVACAAPICTPSNRVEYRETEIPQKGFGRALRIAGKAERFERLHSDGEALAGLCSMNRWLVLVLNWTAMGEKLVLDPLDARKRAKSEIWKWK